MSTIRRALCCAAVIGLGGALAAPAMGADALIPGKQFAAQAKGKVKIQAKDSSVVIGTGDPTVSGATLDVFDEDGSTNYSISLPSSGWSGTAEKGFKYKGAGSGGDPCKGVKLKAGQLKAKCSPSPVPSVPFVGDAGVVLTIDTDRYCMEFPVAGALKNDEKQVKIKGPVPAPGACPAVTPTECAITSGTYTFTQTSGGTLRVAGIGAPNGFDFPAGGTIVQDVAEATFPDCVHETVVPATGGFSAPQFCIPGLNFTVELTQTGCGVGRIDDNGGSDFTIHEVGDTSDDGSSCAGIDQSASCVGGVDNGMRVDITVGGDGPDVCGSGTANAIVTIPVQTHTWTVPDPDPMANGCPDNDGTFDMGTDGEVLLVNQVLDFTSDTTFSEWSDLDGDGCTIAGIGPAAGLSRTGTCADLDAMTATTAATGTIGSAGGPLFDLTFASLLPNAITGPGAPLGATCPSPPAIDFAGTATRCTAP